MSTDFARTKALFDLPEGVIYLDGNSLGPLPKGVAERVAQTITQDWGQRLIRGWNEAGWMDMPTRIGDRIARLVGAETGSVVVGDTLSIKVWQALSAALGLRPDRRVILSDTGNFPSDLYIASGLCRQLGQGYELRLSAPEALEAAITSDVAVVLVTETDYRTGRRHDMAQLIRTAHAQGALVVWDLAHSAGAFDVALATKAADFAVGCTYKYFNAGPGAPAFLYAAPRHIEAVVPALAGWLGHDAPFAFDLDYRPAPGIARMRVGTPPILALAALDAALDIWEGVDMADLYRQSLALQDLFIDALERGAPDLVLATPRRHSERGSQVSFRHPEAYAVMQALIAQGVIGDFRAPDVLRFGFTPLFIDQEDVKKAAKTLITILETRAWDQPAFQNRAKVT